MIRLTAVIDRFEDDFLVQYRNRLTSDHYRALAAMKQCRTPASPMIQVKCTGCAQQKLVPHSCGHRQAQRLGAVCLAQADFGEIADLALQSDR